MRSGRALMLAVALIAACSDDAPAPIVAPAKSVARQWDEEALSAIRIDLPRPPVHARNLYYLSAAMWDAWVAYDEEGDAVIAPEPKRAAIQPEREVAVSYAAYRVLSHLYSLSVSAAVTQPHLDARMATLGLDKDFTATDGDTPAALGNRVASAVLAHALLDGANEAQNYTDPTYTPVNEPLIVKQPGTVMSDPNRWQPLALDFQVSQNGIPIPGKIQVFTGSQWNDVQPFALTRANAGDVYIDPGPPPQLGDAEFTAGVVQLLQFSQQLDASDPTMIDISPATFGNNPLGTNDGAGYAVNPVTGQPYAPQLVRRADFARVLSEFWADGPTSETPPGHWNVLANYVSDQPSTVKRVGAAGPVVDDLEWDVKLYLALNGALHDAAIECWGVKRKYDSVRPISQVRYLGGLGQLPQVPGLIETITAESSAPDERHEALADHVGEIAVKVWPGQPTDPLTQTGGTRWIRAVEWVPFQRSTFVTPPFASYFSGHSTFSRSAAEVLTAFTGSAYFPGGMGEALAPANHFLQFEIGPSTDVRLQWATYYDAADQAGLSRLYGGIHPRVDDFTGRRMGAQVGASAWEQARRYFAGTASR